MPRKIPPSEKAGVSNTKEWWTGSESRMYLGSISQQRWGRLLKEHEIPTETDAKGILRFDSDVVAQLGDDLGLVVQGGDPVTTAIRMLRETVETLTTHIREMHASQRLVMDTLLAENKDIRAMRAKEQEAHLAALIATQEAMDLSAERQRLALQTEMKEARFNMAADWMLKNVAPEIVKQWREGAPAGKLIKLLQILPDDQIEILKSTIPQEYAQALEALRNDKRRTEAPFESVNPSSELSQT